MLCAFFFAFAVFSACGDDDEDFTCNCTTTVTDGAGTETTSTTSTTISGDRSSAEATCSAGDSSTTLNDISTVTVCTLQ